MPNPKTINILGATGSIGQSAQKVILSAPGHYDVQVVTAHSNVQDLAKAARALNAEIAVIAAEDRYAELKQLLEGSGIKAMAGQHALIEAATTPADVTLAAIMGLAGLEPLWQALEFSRAVAIANKEPLVAAGPLVMERARDFGTVILPVDSEHNGLFQILNPAHKHAIEKVILTASGGPFRTWTKSQMRVATPVQALNHPTWQMGRKISIDSATMMNKALEIIEAHVLFDLAPEKIEVLVHPQSLVHALVEYADGSVLAHMGPNDMCTSLTHVLGWPERMKTPGRKLAWNELTQLSFEPVDSERFPAVQLAYEVLAQGLSARAAMNAANEIAVEYFLSGRIEFLQICKIVATIVNEVTSSELLSKLEDILLFDAFVKKITMEFIDKGLGKKVNLK